jgi:membrane protein required for colicin V production
MNGLDTVVVAVILLSALFGFTRGLVKEALSIAVWIGAGFASAYSASYVFPRVIPKNEVAEIIAFVVLFLVALVVLSFISSMVTARVRQSTLSTLDRTLGLLFGVLRGALLVCLAYIALDWAMPPGPDRPAWIEEARTHYLLENGAERLRALVPRGVREKAMTAIGDRIGERNVTAEQIKEATGAIRALSTPRGAPAAQGRESGSSYSHDDRHELDRLIQQRQDERSGSLPP